MGNDQLPPERASEKHILSREASSFTAQQKKLFYEKDKDTGEFTYMGR